MIFKTNKKNAELLSSSSDGVPVGGGQPPIDNNLFEVPAGGLPPYEEKDEASAAQQEVEDATMEELPSSRQETSEDQHMRDLSPDVVHLRHGQALQLQ